MHLNDLLSDYLSKTNINTLIDNQTHKNSTLLPLNLTHIHQNSPELFHAISKNFPLALNEIHKITNFTPQFTNNPFIYSLRDLKTQKINKLTTFKGIITRTSPIRPELKIAAFECYECKSKIKNVNQESTLTLPLLCNNHLCKNRSKFRLLLNESTFYDSQKIMVQEANDEMREGSLPRSFTLICHDELCEKVKAGDKVIITGYLFVQKGKYINLINSKSISETEGDASENNTTDLNYKLCFMANNFENVKEEKLESTDEKIIFIDKHETQLADNKENQVENDSNKIDDKKTQVVSNTGNVIFSSTANLLCYLKSIPDLYTSLANSLFPNIFGHSLIKKSILLMLAGGNSKKDDNVTLRGDINILLVGDPGTAKSQFLKQTSAVLPRSVYTSGKSASAAGLTACVVRDTDGDFTIEAGALMLSDNGVCCIDEFDKMKSTDRVSIHEAMEQQTITINKAGINATLNARCCVLAAANPVDGKYDEGKNLRGNINLSDPIMSRFDLFFVLIDRVDETHDTEVAQQIIDNHSGSDSQDIDKRSDTKILTIEEIREFLLYVKKSVFPEIGKDVAKLLVEKYTKLRQESLVSQGNYKITVRQLESLIRLSEAIARIHVDNEVKLCYVEEAFRLIQSSIIEIKSEECNIRIQFDDKNVVCVEQSDFQRIMHTFVYILKTKEKLDKDSLILEYLEMREEFLVSEEMFNKENELAANVLDYLLHKEGVFYEIEGEIYIHPQYEV